MLKILTKDDPLLRQTATDIAESEFGSAKLKNELRAMRETLENFDDGIALAAPQIGLSKRIFIISEKNTA